MKRQLLVMSLLSFSLWSCEKDKAPQPDSPTPPKETPKVNFELSFTPAFETTSQFELIVSKVDGTVLLDTLLAASAKHSLQVASEDDKFNVSTITRNSSSLQPEYYLVRTFLQVNPSNWIINEGLEYTKNYYQVDSEVASNMRYTNLPKNFGGFGFMSTKAGILSAGTSSASRDITIQYNRMVPSTQTLLQLFDLGKYIYAEVETDNTVVDFSEAGELTRHNFVKPHGLDLSFFNLMGHRTKGNFLNPLQVYNTIKAKTSPLLINPITDDVMYPAGLFEEYELTASFKDKDQNEYFYYKFLQELPSDLSFIKKPDYTVANNGLKDIKVSAGAEKPTHYVFTFHSSDRKTLDASWIVYGPATLESINAQDEHLDKMKNNLLKNKDLSTLKLSNSQWVKASGYTYHDYLKYTFNPDAMKRKELKEYIRYTSYY